MNQIGFNFEANVKPVDVARKEMLQAAKSGEITDCPCCRRTVKLYKRRINKTMARFLIWICQQGEDWSYGGDAPAWACTGIGGAGGGNVGMLAHWKLIESMPNDDPKKKTSGYWKPTEAAYRYLRGEPVAKFANILLGDVVGYSMETATIADALDTEFNYSELMEWCPAT